MRMLHSEGAGRGADSEMKMNKYNIPRDKDDDLKVRDAGKYDRDIRIGVSINEDNGQAEPLDADDPFEILARKQDREERGYDEDENEDVEKFVPTSISISEVSEASAELEDQRAIRRVAEKNAGWSPRKSGSLHSPEPVKPVPTTEGFRRGLHTVDIRKGLNEKRGLEQKPKRKQHRRAA